MAAVHVIHVRCTVGQPATTARHAGLIGVATFLEGVAMRTDEFPKAIKTAAYERSNGACEGCGMPFSASQRPEYDHRIPIFDGGDASVDNCQVLCAVCHRGKSVQEAPRFAKSRREDARRMGMKESRSPLPCGRRSRLKRKISGEVVPRD